MRDITLEDTFRHHFTTRAFATGIPTVLAGTPVLSVLEENNATPITTGVSVNVDRASVVGLNEATIVATAANGYEAGKSYSIYISTGTVSGVSVVGEVVGQFTIAASAAAVDLANGTDGLGAIKAETAIILVDTADMQPRVVAIEIDTGTTLDGRIPAALVGGLMDANVGAISADVTAADNLELDYDGTGLTRANSTIGTVTANTDMRGTDSALLAASAPTNFGDLSITATTGLINMTQAAADKVFGSSGATLAELAQGIPPATPRPDQAMMLGYMALRNKLDVATVATDTLEIHNDAGTRITQKLLTDDGTDYSEAKMISGA